MDSAEQLLIDFAVTLVVALAKQHKVNPHHLALAVPGLCHTHHPSPTVHAACVFCQRTGNVYAPSTVTAAAAEMDPAASSDLVDKHRRAIAAILAKFGDEVLDVVRDAKSINVEDVRAKMVAPLKCNTT